jgi:amidophosphoribosyltransferase
MGHDDDLISSRLSLEELRKEIGADSLAFLSLEGMMKAVGKEDGYCNACFTGDYPITITKRLSKGMFDQVLA